MSMQNGERELMRLAACPAFSFCASAVSDVVFDR